MVMQHEYVKCYVRYIMAQCELFSFLNAGSFVMIMFILVSSELICVCHNFGQRLAIDEELGFIC